MPLIRKTFKNCPEILNLLLFILGGVALTYITKNDFSVFAPFIISYVITVMLQPVIVKIQDKTKMPSAPATVLALLLFVTLASSVIWLFSHYISEGLTYLVNLLSSPSTLSTISTVATNLMEKTTIITDFFKIEITTAEIMSTTSDLVKNAINAVSSMSINLVLGIPNFIIAFVIGCVAAFYMLFDYDRIYNAIIRQCSEGTHRVVHIFNTQVLTSLIKMIVSYILISIVCLAELLIGFYILGIKDATFIAFLIAIFDVLPVVGSGGILVPWGIVSCLMGDPFVGIGLIVLWIVVVVVRQIIEPKIVGEQVGLYPLTTVIALYVGLRLMGGVGLVVAPLYVIVCKKLNEEGIIKLYKTRSETTQEKVEEDKLEEDAV